MLFRFHEFVKFSVISVVDMHRVAQNAEGCFFFVVVLFFVFISGLLYVQVCDQF